MVFKFILNIRAMKYESWVLSSPKIKKIKKIKKNLSKSVIYWGGQFFYKVKLSFDLCNFAFAKKLILPVKQLFLRFLF